jgi:Phosphoesterase family
VEQIKHIVLLMMENRSFDHHFGALNLPPELRSDVNGLGPNAVSNLPIPLNPYMDGTADDPGVAPWSRVTDVQTDWLARFNAAGNLPEQTDLAEAFVEMAHLNNLDGMRALLEEDYYRISV